MIARSKDDIYYFENIAYRHLELLDCLDGEEVRLPDYPYLLKNNRGRKKITTRHLSILIPKSWEYEKLRGIDTEAGEFRTDEGHVLHFSSGHLADTVGSSWGKQVEEMVAGREPVNMIEEPGTHLLMVCCPADTINLIHFNQSTYHHRNLNGIEVSMVIPKVPGTGLTGIGSFDLYGEKRCMCDRPELFTKFHIYGQNLPPELQQEVLETFSTIKLLLPSEKK